jgi:hypothetical protein
LILEVHLIAGQTMLLAVRQRTRWHDLPVCL